MDLEPSLAPVLRALLDDARTEAHELRAAALRDADDLVAAAEAEVAEQVAAARRRAELTERARAEREIAAVRGEAHSTLLELECELRQRWIDRVHERLPELLADPGHPRLVESLETLARAQLGDGARIEHDPDGGFAAVAAGRRVDYRLHALATRAIDVVAEEAATSWT